MNKLILISNDDGIHSEGIKALARAMAIWATSIDGVSYRKSKAFQTNTGGVSTILGTDQTDQKQPGAMPA